MVLSCLQVMCVVVVFYLKHLKKKPQTTHKPKNQQESPKTPKHPRKQLQN